jgi:2'-5' RNA ligase
MDTDSAVRAVVAFPLLEAADRQWIESIRAKHDPEGKRIGAHFTLVFPAVLPLRATEAHVTRVAHKTEPIRFVLRRAAVAPDALGSGGHVFLIPEDGRDALVGLHERLYEGVLQPHVKRGASFTPHITVAAGTAIDPLHTLAGELNARGFSIRGSISEVVLVDVTPAGIRPAAHVPLGSLV